MLDPASALRQLGLTWVKLCCSGDQKSLSPPPPSSPSRPAIAEVYKLREYYPKYKGGGGVQSFLGTSHDEEMVHFNKPFSMNSRPISEFHCKI